jgi:uncharacterized membrane protein (DUF373 family)
MFRNLSGDRKADLLTVITKVQGITILTLMVLLVLVVVVSTVHLEIFGYFLLVLIGVELLETLKMYLKDDVIHMRVVIEVALIAMSRKVITAEPETISSLTLFAIAALILVLGVTYYFERREHVNRTPAR